MDTNKTGSMNDPYTMFVLSMVMASVLAIPVIISTTHATAMWRLFKKG